METFDYKGNTFKTLRNLTAVESGMENIESRTGGFRNIIPMVGYSHDDFYSAAKNFGNETDLYMMNGSDVVLPHSIGLLRYDEKARLTHEHLTYFTECCGKTVSSRKDDFKSGYKLSGKFQAEGGYYCPRCKRDVTRTGKIKNTPRNRHIDENGNWGYTLESGTSE